MDPTSRRVFQEPAPTGSAAPSSGNQKGTNIPSGMMEIVNLMLQDGLRLGGTVSDFEHNAKVQYSLGRFPLADGCFCSALNMTTDETKKPYYLFMRAVCHCYFGNQQGYAKAIELFKDVLRDYSGKSQWAPMANAYRLLIENRNENVARAFAHETDPRLPEGKTIAPFYCGNVLNSSKKDEVIRSFEAVVKENPDNALAWEYIGVLYMDKDLEKAVNAFKNLVRLIPNHEKGWEFLSVSYLKLDEGKYGASREYIGETLEALKKTLEINIKNMRAYSNYAFLREDVRYVGSWYSKNRNWEEARGGFESISLDHQS